MFEKVNPSHPDKIADRIAGALVDLAYKKKENPKVAVEVLIGHGRCLIINETDTELNLEEVFKVVERIAGEFDIEYIESKQDEHLSKNQQDNIRCGDNGIFKGVPITSEEFELSSLVKYLYSKYPHDGKYIIQGEKVIACQSNAEEDDLKKLIKGCEELIINPLGPWTGGTDVDTGATNRKLGSDMAQSVTGGGLHGKDLSKADVSVNIYAFLKAQKTKEEIKLHCAIGDEEIDGKPYEEIVEIAREYIKNVGGFEKFAEWGLV